MAEINKDYRFLPSVEMTIKENSETTYLCKKNKYNFLD